MSQWWRHPIVRSCVAYCCLYPGANIVQQTQIRKTPIDWSEARRFLIYGGFVHAPLVYGWIRIAGTLFPGRHWGAIFKKVALDQTVFAPVALSSFYIGLTLLEGKSRDEIYAEWRAKFPTTWAKSAFIWPFLQTFNFRYVPMRNRAIFVGSMSFFWTTALSYWKSIEISQD